MSDILLSIVIPAYNAEPYLQKCVDSCLNQEECRAKYEIIIVNDGSTDGTQDIIDCYTTKYNQISCISQENGGLSKARNEGLKKAQGEYVWFVDSDDWIAKNALSTLSRIIEYNSPDVITFKGYDWKDENLAIRRNNYSKSLKSISGTKVLKMMGTTAWNPCAQFYCMKKQFLIDNILSFMEGVIHEDSEFTPRMLYKAKSVCICIEPLYYVFHNPVSLNRKKNPEKGFHTLRVVDSLCSFCERIVEKENQFMLNDIIALTMNSAMKETKDMDEVLLREFCKNIQTKTAMHMLYAPTLKYKIEGLLLWMLPSFLVKFIRNHQ